MKTKIFGCKVNKYFTEKWVNSEYLKDKDGIFIATCVVTDKAKRKWIKFVKNSIKDLSCINNLDLKQKIYISGCGAFINGKVQNNFYDLYPELNKFKDIIELLDEEPISVNSNTNNFLNLYTKKFIVIQSGCDSFCTYCLTVKKRGRHFFRKKEDILKEINDFEQVGGKEVVLTGINLGAWGLSTTNDLKTKPKLIELLNFILKNSKIKRIRISSLGPEFIDDDLINIFSETRIYPHIHISIQSASSKILKLMNRHYNNKKLEEILQKIQKIKRKDGVNISIGADIIVGFPSESKENFLETYDLVKKYKINKLHSFPFSDHKIAENVVAGNFENQVSGIEKKDRLKKLNNLGNKIRTDFIKKNIGKTFEVLIELVKGKSWKGWTQNYIEITEKNFDIISGEVIKNEIVVGILK